MWKNPFLFNNQKILEDRAQPSTFADAQGFVNFVVLEPSVLPVGCSVEQVLLRAETPKVRSSLRFTVQGDGRAFRVKEFFYDWSYPVVLADTNMVTQGQPFVAHDVVGFLSTDYKGHVAGCHSRWYTQVELSVLEGTFAPEELVQFFEGLRHVREEAVEQIGLLPFAVTSHTQRYHQPMWGLDQVVRAQWYPYGEFHERIDGELLLPPERFREFVADSIGYKIHPEGEEYQQILRSQRNETDAIWYWAAPERLSEWVPPRYGSRQEWTVEEVTVQLNESGEELHAWLAEQPTAGQVGGWRMHWKLEGLSYHVHVRPSAHFTKEDLVTFVSRLRRRWGI